mgnify:CR=1 FL=1|tara:strand:- start:87976 stop:88893 length:918 start_codon:yes stop_codon:yes gene_type:complete
METNKPIRQISPHNMELETPETLFESTGSVLSYALRFQSQLCIETLLQSYEECIQSLFNIHGIRYRYPLLGATYSLGTTYNAQCNFQLNTNEEFWGDITIYRGKELTESEMKNIELISSLLVHPLRAIIHQKSNSLLSFNEETTGVANATLVEQLVTREAKLANRERVPMSLVLIDIDRFQNISESADFIVRDEILYNVMRVMRNCIRDTDLLFRYENDIYCLILKGVTDSNALQISERIRKAIDSYSFTTEKNKISHITVSSGISTLLKTDSIETIFDRTTRAVQHAKKMGRNQSIVADGKFIS